MRKLRSLIDPGGRSLIYHLDRLRQTLDALTTRLRAAVAEAVSQAAAGVVRDTIQGMLADPAVRERPRYRADYGPRRNSWDDYDGPGPYGHDPERPYRHDPDRPYGYRETRYDDDDDVYDSPSPRRPPTNPESRNLTPSRWSQALAAGLRAAAWWLQDRTGMTACLVALGIGSSASLAFLFGGMATASGISVVLSLLSLTGLQALLNDAARRTNSLGMP
jgi:hypothetical protein